MVLSDDSPKWVSVGQRRQAIDGKDRSGPTPEKLPSSSKNEIRWRHVTNRQGAVGENSGGDRRIELTRASTLAADHEIQATLESPVRGEPRTLRGSPLERFLPGLFLDSDSDSGNQEGLEALPVRTPVDLRGHPARQRTREHGSCQGDPGIAEDRAPRSPMGVASK